MNNEKYMEDEDDIYQAVADFRTDHPAYRKWYFKVIFRWYDLWVGAFIDRRNTCVYVFPIPMLGIKFGFTIKYKGLK